MTKKKKRKKRKENSEESVSKLALTVHHEYGSIK